MCNKAVEKYSWCLEYVPDEFKTRDICDKALLKEVCCVEHVPDYFITEEKLENLKKK